MSYEAKLTASPLPVPVFPVLTIVFITSGSVIVSYVSVRAYVKEGLPSMLFLGSGSLVFGVAALVAALLAGNSGSNISTLVFILAAVCSAVLHLSCAASRFFHQSERRGSGLAALGVMALSVLLVGAIVLAAGQGVLPRFLNPGAGATSAAKTVLGGAIAIFGLAAVLIGLRSTSSILYWYSWSLATIAVGLFALLLSDWQFDAVVFWVGRIGICLGGILMVMSVLSAEGGRSPQVAGVED